MIKSHSEMAHILGLNDNPFTSTMKNNGWHVLFAWSSTKNRYNALVPESDLSSDLNFNLLALESPSQAARKISSLSNSEYIGFATSWWKHTFTLHAIREADHTHFIYVNRGERHLNPRGEEELTAPAVMVFTVDNTLAENFAKEMMSAALSLNTRSRLSNFINDNQHHLNTSLSKKLAKSDQKTGNCTIANSNIAWHFQLASNEMKKGKTSFEQAYDHTKIAYKGMRINDRVQAFLYLLQDKRFYLSEKAYLYNYFQALTKFKIKDYKNKTHHIESLVNAASPKTLSSLINPLISHHFSKNVEEYLLAIKKQSLCDDGSTPTPKMIDEYIQVTRTNLYVAKDAVLDHAFKKLETEVQEKLIMKDISLIKYAKSELQQQLLKKDFNKYALYINNNDPIEQLIEHGNDEKHAFKASSETATSQRKTNDNLFLSKGSLKKERHINNLLRALYSYASQKDEAKIKETFESLCLVCCERRFYLAGSKYSANTSSAKWLLNQFATDARLSSYVKKSLGIKHSDTLEEKIKEVISRNNTVTTRDYHQKIQEHQNPNLDLNSNSIKPK